MRKRRPAILVVLVVLGALAPIASYPPFLAWGAQAFWRHDPPEPRDGIAVTRDVVFATRPTGDLLLDVYRPSDPSEGSRPVVLYAFGGGWMSGNRHQIVVLDLLRLVDRGYALVTADVDARLRVVPGGNHGGDEYATREMFEEIVAFLDRSLGRER